MRPFTGKSRCFSSPVLMSAVLALALAGCGGGDDDAKILRVQGAVTAPAEYSASDLQAQPATTQSVSFLSGTTPQTHTYTGTGTWALLNAVGLTVDATKKNDVLNRYVLATGADGYRAAFSLGELSPDFGNVQSLLAYSETTSGLSSPLTAADGPLRITAPGDVKGGRYVSNVIKLEVRQSGSAAASAVAGVSTSFTVSGAVVAPATWTAATLRTLPATTVTVGANVYTGVSLWTLLGTTAGLKLDNTIKNPGLSLVAVATGSDGYKALVTLGEIDPGFGNRPAIVAYAVNGAGLGTSGDTRLIVGGDVKQGRSVSNLVAIEVIAAAASQ